MIKKIIFILSLSLFSISIAQADMHQPPQGWYIEGSTGDFFDSSFTRHARSPLLGASIGYKDGPLRFEGKYIYQSLDAQRIIKGSYNALRLAGFYDFDNQTIFSPYLGLGLAFSKTRFDYSYQHPYIQEEWGYTSVYPTATLGVRAYLNDHIALDLALGTSSNDGIATLGFVYHF